MKSVAVAITSPNIACNIGEATRKLSDNFIAGLGYRLRDSELSVASSLSQNQS